MIRTNGKAILASALAVLMTASPALAGRGGFGGGGFRGGGGGGGFRGGGYGGGGFRGGDFGGGGFRGGDFGGGGFRGGNNFGGGSFNRTPSFDAGRFNSGNLGGNYGNRGNFSNDANRYGIGNRGAIGNNVNGGNRFNNDNFGGGNRVNSGNLDGNRVGNTNISNRQGNTNNINVNNSINGGNRTNVGRFGNSGVNAIGDRGWGGYGNIQNRSYGYGNWRNPAYNRGWVHGYWNGWNSGSWNNAAWFGLGAGLGWGLSAWSYGPWLYNWGYSSYSNPYYVVQQPIVVNQPAPAVSYDYAQPINTAAAPPAQTDDDAATALFDQARDAFLKNDFQGALTLANQALAKIPNDSALHEFRALCQFALGQYDAAAEALFAVLSVGPGWDWTTLISLYPSVDTYTAQLRALETYVKGHEDSAAAHFVLGYHYMTENFPDQAAKQFARVAQLKPSDTLSAQLAQHLAKAANPDAAPAATPAAAEPAPAAAKPMPAGATLAGQWTASPAAGTTIALAIAPDNTFTWTVKGRGGDHTMKGTATYGDGLLTLAQSDGPPLVGRVSWTDAQHLTFRVDGGPANDPGLTFAKS